MAEGDFRGRPVCCGRCRARRFPRRETDYLLAVAVLRQYAAAPDARNLPDNCTAEPVTGFASCFRRCRSGAIGPGRIT